MTRRKKGGRISLTAFEAAWLHMVADTNTGGALAAIDYLGIEPPESVRNNPSEAWDQLVSKIALVAPDSDDD